jgi:hypothetical protein
MTELEERFTKGMSRSEEVRWFQVYSYSFNESLAGCAEELERMEQYTKLIVGEQGGVDCDGIS